MKAINADASIKIINVRAVVKVSTSLIVAFVFIFCFIFTVIFSQKLSGIVDISKS
jgi:hypothetical protein